MKHNVLMFYTFFLANLSKANLGVDWRLWYTDNRPLPPVNEKKKPTCRHSRRIINNTNNKSTESRLHILLLPVQLSLYNVITHLIHGLDSYRFLSKY